MNSQKGVSLIITFFIMVIMLTINLSISAILYNQIKLVRNIGDSVIAFYLADSGIEKTLYFDNKAVPDIEGVKRGLCAMCQPANPYSCQEDPGSGNVDKSIYCDSCQITETSPGGCAIEKCDACQVSFETSFGEGRRYKITATSGSLGSNDMFTKIDSTGYYKEEVLRALEANLKK